LKYTSICPCCNKELNIEIVESGGEVTATLSYPEKVVSKEELEAHGYEFGESRRKSIFNYGIARRLIQLGNIVVDIKPLKEDPNKTVFIFDLTKKLINDLAKFSD
jgi:hypothetical protein